MSMVWVIAGQGGGDGTFDAIATSQSSDDSSHLPGGMPNGYN